MRNKRIKVFVKWIVINDSTTREYEHIKKMNEDKMKCVFENELTGLRRLSRARNKSIMRKFLEYM